MTNYVGIIFSDSKTAFKCIASKVIRSETGMTCREALSWKRHQRDVKVRMQWVPGHSDMVSKDAKNIELQSRIHDCQHCNHFIMLSMKSSGKNPNPKATYIEQNNNIATSQSECHSLTPRSHLRNL